MAYSYLAFLVAFLPYFLSPLLFTSPSLSSLPSEIIFALPYVAPVIAGVALSYLFPQNKTRHSVVLGTLIAASFAIGNLVAPHIGLWSDLPGLYYSSWIFLFSLPIAIFLVVAGSGLKSLWGTNEKDT